MLRSWRLRIPTTELSRYLLTGRLSRRGCLNTRLPRIAALRQANQTSQSRASGTRVEPVTTALSDTTATPTTTPLYKQLKEQAKVLKASGKKKKNKADNQTLNMACKLFSPAATSFNDKPNSHVALFDVAMPGSRVVLHARDGIAPKDGDRVEIGIRQPGGVYWLDFNRIRHPATAAAFVRKVQMLLASVDAYVSGMEAGGLRADVNVSVYRTGGPDRRKLGTRTEIKNLSSFKAVEDAIIAERDRQIAVLEAGGVVEGETRGWSLGSTETCRLRGKEGEVDYRYMPDPDLGPVVIGDNLVAYLASSIGVLPDAEIDELIEKYGLSAKDALSLMILDDGARIQYFYNASSELTSDLGMTPEGECHVPSVALAAVLSHLHRKEITAKVAKELLWGIFRGEITADSELSEAEYAQLADRVVEGEDKVLGEFLRFKQGKAKAYPQGKLMFLVGKMMRAGTEQRMDPASAERVLRARLENVHVPRLAAK
ncbi:hypothetical protein C7999DRAFT_44680 [Corynascus novoguineensis]|uniref:Asn/Gln amidotransferase domain-containing protein n=1 Tax=Corynascus novoguineensis TaxID=1126955 RepID=A0AAN7CKX1_9PEZI|nr:hypothetical protein C7999DRAFT_44680 [Corynascus novoguineensis]